MLAFAPGYCIGKLYQSLQVLHLSFLPGVPAVMNNYIMPL
jgi:hypothetical protein